VTGSATPASGSTTKTLTASVTASERTMALVDLEVSDAAGRTAYHRAWNNQTFQANSARTFSTTWTPPATASGTYTVKIGVYAPGWGDLFAWNNRAGTFTAGSSSSTTTTTTTAATTTTTAATTTTTRPTTTTTTRPTTTTTGATTTTAMPAGDAMHHACPGVPDVTPLGAVPPALPMMCDMLNSGGRDTHTAGANSWLDDFNHGQLMANIPAAYKVFNGVQCQQNLATATGCKYGTFLHNNHWMQDIYGPAGTGGGAFMRPDRSFNFENGKLTIEFDLAAGGLNYFDEWPEVIVSNSSSPVGFNYGPTPSKGIDDGGYGYGQFGGYYTVGIRMNGDRAPIAAMYDNTQRGFACGRLFEIAWYLDGSNGQSAGCPRLVFNKLGGEPGLAQRELGADMDAWRVCRGNDPDTNCRDRFRWEITTTSLTVYVNGVKWMSHTLPAGQTLPSQFTNNPVYVYFAGWQTQTHHTATARFHWDRMAINGNLPLSQSPTCTPTVPCS
jgi:hypothetical protein